MTSLSATALEITPTDTSTATTEDCKASEDLATPTDPLPYPDGQLDESNDAKHAETESKDTEHNPEPEKQATKLRKTQVAFHRYLKRFWLWNPTAYKYKPHDPSTCVPPAKEPKDPHNYFYVDVRYKDILSEPSLAITHFSKTLVQLFRSLLGGKFFNDEPECTVQGFFPDMYRLRKSLVSVQQAMLPDTPLSSDEILDLAKSLGYLENEDSPTGSGTKTYLSKVVEHLGVLMEYLEEQFRSIAEKLALVTSHGYIEFDLLQYLFEPGQQLTTTDDFGNLICFEIKKRYYYTDVFIIKGYGRVWDGYKYRKDEISREIPAFSNLTAEISGLPVKHLTPQNKETLKVRGQLYTTFLGVHYQLHHGNRVIVDRIAYGTQGGYTRDPNQIFPDIDEELLHLLPSEVYGFNLTKKQWTSFLVEKLKPVIFDQNAWDHLVLDSDMKTLIKGLVEVTKNSNSSSKIITDVISGKGGGLISVLHGPPGTGKTLTAEAIAEILHRPLYMVGASELPTESRYLESKLRGILSLATAWDAVMLIDEADVYLEQRSLHEIERNALVSVALRLLEYHRGVLFLTTNRIKTFDEAFLSRFSIAIKYPELDCKARRVIWGKFLQLAGCNIEELDVECGKSGITKSGLDELAAKEFNGRTIKNLVRTAQALALSSNSPLRLEHVKVVVRAQEKFLDEFAPSNR